MPPDIYEPCSPHTSAGQWELDARIHVAVRRYVAGGMSRAARHCIECVLRGHGTLRRSAEFLDVPDQVLIPENLPERRLVDPQRKNGSVTIHHGRDGGIDAEFRSHLTCQRPHALVICQVLAHEHVCEDHFYALADQKARPFERTLERPRQLCNPVVNFRPMRVDADLHRVDRQIAEAFGPGCSDHYRVALELHAEHQLASMLQNLEKVLPHEDLAAAQRQEKHARFGHLTEQIQDLRGGHFTVVVVIQIAVYTSLVAAIGQIQLHGQRYAQPERPGTHLPHQRTHVCSLGGVPGSAMGESETTRIPWLARSLTNSSASCSAAAGSTSNSAQMRCSTICSSGVTPSAACQIADAVSFKENNEESRPDMIIISPPTMRAATCRLRAT